MVATCAEQRVTASDADFTRARTLLAIVTVLWALPALIGALASRRRSEPSVGYAIAAAVIVALGAIVAARLSSPELCLS